MLRNIFFFFFCYGHMFRDFDASIILRGMKPLIFL